MIQFHELRINPEGTKLIIDVSVKDSIYYENVYIDTVSIDTQDTFINDGPSDNIIYTNTLTGDNKSVRLELGVEDLLPSLINNMFFVWVKTKGIPAVDTPCGEDNTLILGVAIALCSLYQQAFGYIRELEKECIIPKGFINFILQLKALQLAIETGHYIQAIKYWRMIIRNKYDCHGRIS